MVTPARNEADVVGQSMAALLAQDYPGTIYIVLVDDDSTDGTGGSGGARRGEIADPAQADRRQECRLGAGLDRQALGRQPWPAEAARLAPEAKYVLLTDADILHERTSLRQLVSKAEQSGFKMVSLMARLKTETLAERALIPAYIFYFQKLYPFAWVSDPSNKTGGAAGGCMLVDREALERRSAASPRSAAQLIDDCALGKAIKAKGPDLPRPAPTASPSLLRGYPRWSDVWMLIARSAFTPARLQRCDAAGCDPHDAG